MSDTIIGAIIGAVAAIIAAIIGLFCVQKKANIKVKQKARGQNITQIGIQNEKKTEDKRDVRKY